MPRGSQPRHSRTCQNPKGRVVAPSDAVASSALGAVAPSAPPGGRRHAGHLQRRTPRLRPPGGSSLPCSSVVRAWLVLVFLGFVPLCWSARWHRSPPGQVRRALCPSVAMCTLKGYALPSLVRCCGRGIEHPPRTSLKMKFVLFPQRRSPEAKLGAALRPVSCSSSGPGRVDRVGVGPHP